MPIDIAISTSAIRVLPPRWAKAILGRGVYALADQVLISATSLVTMVLLARVLSLPAFGAFALVQTVILFINSFQAALITQPHNVLGAGRQGLDYARYTSSLAVGQLALTGLAAAIGLAAWATACSLGWSEAPLLLAAVPAIAGWQLQEFVRRVLYTEGRLEAALVNDLISYGGQVLAFLLLAGLNALSGATALCSLATAAGVATAVGCRQLRGSLAGPLEMGPLRENWSYGKWLAGSQLLGHWFASLLLMFASAALLGTTAAGILKAVNTLFGPTRMLAQMFSTTLPTHFARILAVRGAPGLNAQLRHTLLTAVPAFGGYCLLVAIFAEPLLSLVFGPVYRGHGEVVAWYAISVFFSCLTIIGGAVLRAKRQTRAIFVSELVSMAAFPLVLVLAPPMGLYGVILTMIAADLALLGLLGWAHRQTRTEPSLVGSRADSLVCPRAKEGPTVTAGQTSDNQSLHGTQPAVEGRGRLLAAVFDLLDRAPLPYCVMHGYEGYPSRVPSDVDCVLPTAGLRERLFALLSDTKSALQAEVVQWWEGQTNGIVLAGKNADGSPCFLQLDVSHDYRLRGLPIRDGNEIVESRRRHGQFWVPAVAVEFGCYLKRRIVKDRLNAADAQRLNDLFREDPVGCRDEILRFQGGCDARRLLLAASESGDWSGVRRNLRRIRWQLEARVLMRRPLRAAEAILAAAARRLRWCLRPACGFHVTLLGPDGAGKSSVAAALCQQLEGAFLGTSLRSFPPRLLKRNVGDPGTPQALRPRSRLSSIARAMLYWFPYYSPGYYLTIRPALVRSSLVVHDRHLIDCIVDPVRYRYAGPTWLIRLLWRLTPKPDLVVLLHARPEVIQQRKQEVPLAETARQQRAYRELLTSLPGGLMVDAEQPLDRVVAAVTRAVLERLTARVAGRFEARANSASASRQPPADDVEVASLAQGS